MSTETTPQKQPRILIPETSVLDPSAASSGACSSTAVESAKRPSALEPSIKVWPAEDGSAKSINDRQEPSEVKFADYDALESNLCRIKQRKRESMRDMRCPDASVGIRTVCASNEPLLTGGDPIGLFPIRERRSHHCGNSGTCSVGHCHCPNVRHDRLPLLLATQTKADWNSAWPA